MNGRLPPVFGILFGPARLWRTKGSMLSHCGTDNLACRVYQQDARAAGADVNSNQFHRFSRALSSEGQQAACGAFHQLL
jgi:hypothetical protein